LKRATESLRHTAAITEALPKLYGTSKLVSELPGQ
jgi:hypothetical protein